MLQSLLGNGTNMQNRLLEAQPSGVSISRNTHGVVHIDGQSETDLYWGLGFAQAKDRGLQLLFMRILGQGRLSEILDSSDASLEIDTFFRKMHWRRTPDDDARLSPRAQRACESYISGINCALKQALPWELKLFGYQLETWTVNDTYLIARMVSYLTLAQSQGELEHLIVQMVQAGVAPAKLESLFGTALKGIDTQLLSKVKLNERFVPDSVKWGAGCVRLMASNNWVIGGEKTKSGKPLLGSDPHLEINRLPSVWYEVVMKQGDRYAVTATMPGIPGMIIGRSNDLSWGPTYTFMDTVDSWVEHCRDGNYRKGEDWHPFRVRSETILRKNKKPVPVQFYENEHGVLEGDPFTDEYALCTRWSTAEAGPVSIEMMIQLWDANTVEEGMDVLGQLEPAFNWVLADTKGNIGYQMSGLLPLRREGWSGLYPTDGSNEDNDWRGFASHLDLPRILNPDRGFFVTANQDLNAFGNVLAINACQGPYRSDRIASLIEKRDDWCLESSRILQLDTYSVQAEAFLKLIVDRLPDSKNANILRAWNCHYDLDSQGASIFEAFYTNLRRIVFGKLGLGEEVIDFLSDETGIFADFFINFDSVLLSGNGPWFDNVSRDQCLDEALKIALQIDPKAWGDTRSLNLSHILFGGKLPRWLGFDRGPIQLKGGRATPHQGQIYRAAGRTTSFAPSIRFITDMAEDICETCLIGGPSDRRFSKWYASEIDAWLSGRYKSIVGR
jgi:penicillin G amidase